MDSNQSVEDRSAEFNPQKETIIVDVVPNVDLIEKNDSVSANPNENDPILMLKLQVDSMNKQINVYRTILRSIDRFRKCCTNCCGNGDVQFQNEYNKFNQNYLYCRKRIRKYQRQARKLSPHLNSSNPYDTLYRLYKGKISVQDKETDTTIESKTVKTGVNNLETTNVNENFRCFIDECDQTFAEKDFYLDHLAEEHSIDVCQTIVTKNPSTKKVQTKKKQMPVRVSSRRSRSQTVKKTAKKSSPKKILPKKKPIKASIDKPEKTLARKKKGRKPVPKPVPQKTVEETPVVLNCDYEDCKFVGRNRWTLKQHKMTHSDIRPFECDRCDKRFKYKGLLKEHQKSVHDGRRYECPFEGCSTSFANASRLRQHVEIAHTKDPTVYRCTVEGCSYSTFKIQFLRKHSAVHSEDRPYKCMWPGCGKAFKLSNTRNDHILMHKNERRFKCKWPNCSYACNTSNNLLKHHAIHEKKNVSKSIDQNPDQLNLSDEQHQQSQQQLPPLHLQPQFEMMRMDTEVNMAYQ